MSVVGGLDVCCFALFSNPDPPWRRIVFGCIKRYHPNHQHIITLYCSALMSSGSRLNVLMGEDCRLEDQLSLTLSMGFCGRRDRSVSGRR